MRDLALLLAFLATVPFIFKRPAVGVLVYAMFSLMNPHRMAYGFAYGLPFAQLTFIFTAISLLVSKEPKKIPMTGVPVVMIILFAYMTFTTFISQEPVGAWFEWNRVWKTYLMILLTIAALRTPEDVRALAWTVGLSLGFWGFKGGLFTILSGGSSHVLGPASTYISDNNTLALSQIVVIPLLYFMYLDATHKWVKRGCAALVFFTICAAIGSYSRGAMLGGIAMLGFLWLKSRYKVRTGLVVLAVLPLVFLLMPEQWFGRMGTINNYEEDASAMGRINAWVFAINVANDHLFGGGFKVFTARMFQLYAPDPTAVHVAHSIYFQVLGEHGYLGLGLFLTMLFCAWRSGTRVIRFSKGKEELKWAANLAGMAQVSMVGYMAGGAFLSLPWYDLPYYVYAILTLVEKVVIRMPPQEDPLPRLWGYPKKLLSMRKPRPKPPQTSTSSAAG